MTNIHNIIAEENEIGIRLDKFLGKHLVEISRVQIQNLIDNELVKEDGQVIRSKSYKVKKANYEIIIPEPKKNHLKEANIPLDIVYEDDDILLVNKQSGLTTHPGAGNYENTLVNGLIHYLGDNLSAIAGVERPGIVHRLDKDTSGLIIIAKNNLAHLHLADQLKTRTLKRIYHAICIGVPVPPIARIETFIQRNKTNRLKIEVNKYNGKIAITNYKLLDEYDSKLSLVECSLATGRTHQIRVHLSHIGYPIIGDKLYCKNLNTKYINLEDDIKEMSSGNAS